jgi:hypothetical protein
VSNQDYNGNLFSGVDTFRVWNGSSVEEGKALPTVFSLANNGANPFNPSTVITLAVPPRGQNLQSRRVSVLVYDVKGRTVKTLVDGALAPGYHSFVFDGRHQNGQMLSSGIYFCKMTSENYQKTLRLVMMK